MLYILCRESSSTGDPARTPSWKWELPLDHLETDHTLLWLSHLPGLVHVFFIRSSLDGQFRLPPCLGFVNSAAVHFGGACVFSNSSFVGWMARSGIAESYGHSLFSFLRNTPYCFPWWLHQFAFSQQCGRVPLLHTLCCICYL